MDGSQGGNGARDALWALADELECHGVRRMYARAFGPVGVLSVCLGVTVWCDDGRLRWRVLGELVTWPADDPQGAAALLAPLARRGQSPWSPRVL
jgi:hypothetical protein